MVLELKTIEKSFGEKKVLQGISLRAESGKAFGLLGRNGAGKTTAIRILMNIFGANSGEILLDGKPLDHNKVSFGFLPEERGLYPKRVIIEQLVYFAELNGLSHSEAVSQVDKYLARLGMSEYRNKKLETLSKGNQQKIQLITALAHNPDIVILDEPFSGLDPVNAMLLKEIVREQITDGKLVFFSSHQMSYIEEFCDTIAILRDGKIVLQGELHDIKRSYSRNKLVVFPNGETETQKVLSEYAAMGAIKLKDDGILIELESEAQKCETMKELIERYDIDGVKVYEPSLNDIFVEHAGNSEVQK